MLHQETKYIPSPGFCCVPMDVQLGLMYIEASKHRGNIFVADGIGLFPESYDISRMLMTDNLK